MSILRLNQPVEDEDVPENGVACRKFQVRESTMTSRQHQVLNSSTKYKHALQRGQSIADIMSRNGTLVIRQMNEASYKFEDIVEDGVAPFVGLLVKKVLPAIRVFLKSFGDEVTGDVTKTSRRHTAMKYVADTKQAIDWVQNLNIKRIEVPVELQVGVSDIPVDRDAMIKRIPLRRSRSSPFGGLPYRELLSFCETK
ncbi:hypothetical protein PHMEG_00019651 [Phytophthora megakarya]|uniref:Uncharacterized protein n=1 Tax=Phytophthora megakarya TaxID=4795 RepID=A0A225VTM7_9STRA|nr:hypothetical protein PHMEG_00019651 [Phytophthora megakarya]